jgi:hypothetical protein
MARSIRSSRHCCILWLKKAAHPPIEASESHEGRIGRSQVRLEVLWAKQYQ